MRIAPSGRLVFVLQWILAGLLPVFLVLGRGLVGSPLGWMAVIGIWFGLPLLAAMYLGPVLTLFDREVRTAKATRTAYSLASGALWLAAIVTALAVVDGGDDGEVGSALTVWTAGGFSVDASEALMIGAGFVAIIVWVATIVLAIAGIVRDRAGRRAPAAREPSRS